MFARHNTNKISTAAKARLNSTQSHITHKLETNSESSRKHSPEAYPGTGTQLSSGSEVMVFTNTHHGNGGGRQAHTNARSLPTEYPNVDDIQNYFERFWDQKMREINEPNSKLRYLHLGKPNEKNYRKESPTTSQPHTPVKQTSSTASSRSPQHNVNKRSF